MEFDDYFAIFCFILVFKMITSLKMRGATEEDQLPQDETEANAPPLVAPMHMPIQIPRRDEPEKLGTERLAPEKIVPEKILPERLVIDGPIPGEDD